MRNYDFYIDRSSKKVSFTRANCSNVKNFYQNYPKDFAKVHKKKKIQKIITKIKHEKKFKQKQKELLKQGQKEIVVTKTTEVIDEQSINKEAKKSQNYKYKALIICVIGAIILTIKFNKKKGKKNLLFAKEKTN